MCNSIFNTVMLELCAKEFQTVYNKINNNEPIKDLAINDFKTYHNFCAIFIMFIGESLMIVLYFIQRCYTLEGKRSTMEIIPGKGGTIPRSKDGSGGAGADTVINYIVELS